MDPSEDNGDKVMTLTKSEPLFRDAQIITKGNVSCQLHLKAVHKHTMFDTHRQAKVSFLFQVVVNKE